VARRGLGFCVAVAGVVALLAGPARAEAAGVRGGESAVEQAVAALAAGRLDAATLVAGLEPAEAAAPGLLSVYLAAGGALDRPAAEALARWPLEPRLYAMLAAEALERGEPEWAARFVLPGLQLAPRDAWLEDLAARLGWEAIGPAGPALPVPTDAAPPPAWPWYLAGLFAAALLATSAHRARAPSTVLAIAAGVATALALPLGAPVPLPDTPSALTAPTRIGPCARGPARLDTATLALPVRCDGLTRLVRVLPATARDAYLRTPHHALELAGRAPASPALAAALAATATDLRAAETAGWRLTAALAPAPTATGWPRLSLLPPDALARLRLAFAATAATLLILLAAAARALTAARAAAARHPKEARILLAIFALAATLHALAPARMTMVYGGYDLVAHIASATPPRYGPGAVALYGPLLWLATPDHALIIAANRLFGLAALVAAWDLGRTLWSQPPAARIASALALATLPMLLRAHTSESIAVPTTLFFLVAARLTLRPTAPNLPAAITLLVTAALTRPDAAVIAAALPLWALAARGPRPAIPRPALAGALAAALPLAALYAAHLATTARAMSAQDSLTTGADLAAQALGAAFAYGALGDPTFTPLGLWPLCAIAALAHPAARRPALATLALALAWLAVTSIDLARVSIPRLHEPAVLFVLPLAATGLAATLAAARRAAAPLRHRLAPAAFAALWLTSIAYESWALFRPTLEDAEESLWRDAIAALPPGPGCLFAMAYGDPPDPHLTARNNPGYLLAARRPGWRLLNLSALAAPPVDCPRRAVLLGTRCYAHAREPDDPQPPTTRRFPICDAARAAASATPIFERAVPTTDALSLPLYPAAGDLTLGLYPVAESPTTAPPAPAPRPAP
jgi:hypothetical protein